MRARVAKDFTVAIAELSAWDDDPDVSVGAGLHVAGDIVELEEAAVVTSGIEAPVPTPIECRASVAPTVFVAPMQRPGQRRSHYGCCRNVCQLNRCVKVRCVCVKPGNFDVLLRRGVCIRTVDHFGGATQLAEWRWAG